MTCHVNLFRSAIWYHFYDILLINLKNNNYLTNIFKRITFFLSDLIEKLCVKNIDLKVLKKSD